MSEEPTEDLTDFEPETAPAPDGQADSEGEQAREESEADLLERLREEKEELHDRWLRKEADIQNLRKRSARERREAGEAGRAAVLVEILPVIDSCEQGLESLQEGPPSSEEIQAYHQGLELLLKGLRGVLTRFNVSEVPGVGAKFDPMVHEALLVEEREGHEDGEVLELFRKGYGMGKRLLRPAQVKVASAPAPVKED